MAIGFIIPASESYVSADTTVTPDRGLAGALVGNVNKKAIEVIQKSTENYNILSVGRKGFRFLNSRDQNIVEQIEIPDKPEITDTLSISDFAIEGFLEGKCCLLYTSPSPRDGLLSRMPSSA